jgi:hypothetical protein
MLEVFPLSDTAHKYTLLFTASAYLKDPAVIGKWMALAAAETDTRLKAEMLHRLTAGGIEVIPDKSKLLELLSAALQQDEARNIILPVLGKLSTTNSQARKTLMDFYLSQGNAAVSHLILSWLLIPADADEADIDFYTRILKKVDTEDKFLIINRLLLQDKLPEETIASLLTPEEPPVIKDNVIQYCFDRSFVPAEALCHLIRKDKSPALRTRCIQLLAVHGIGDPAVLDVILDTFRSDPDAGVRQAALHVFGYSVTITPAIIDFLCGVLLTEKNTDLALQLLNLLGPYAETSGTLTDALWGLLEKNIQRPLAVRIYTILGRQVPVNPLLFGRYLEAYEKAQADEIKAVLLKALTEAVTIGNERPELYQRALEAPSDAIRELGIRGMLLLPLTKENQERIAAAAPVLLFTGLNRELRRLLAKKISCIPELSAAATLVFTDLASHETDNAIKETCTRVQQKVMSRTGGENINWELWLHKADVERELGGIFPHIWLYYEENPEMASRVLWSSINPANSNSLYREGVDEMQVLDFLSARTGVTDDMARYALNRLLTLDLGYESRFNHYLLLLKRAPSLSELKEGLWQALEKRGRYISLIQLHELNGLIWGAGLEDTFRSRVQQVQTLAGVLPYLNYLGTNAAWGPAPGLIKDIVRLPVPDMRQAQEFKQALGEACQNSGLDTQELLRIAEMEADAATGPDAGFVEEGPGFAD